MKDRDAEIPFNATDDVAPLRECATVADTHRKVNPAIMSIEEIMTPNSMMGSTVLTASIRGPTNIEVVRTYGTTPIDVGDRLQTIFVAKHYWEDWPYERGKLV